MRTTLDLDSLDLTRPRFTWWSMISFENCSLQKAHSINKFTMKWAVSTDAFFGIVILHNFPHVRDTYNDK